MSVESTHEVVIVGAGPVGLSAALLLARQGVDVEVLERRTTPSDQPRAHVINARTMELFDQWGIADRIREAALPAELATAFVWADAINGTEYATLDYLDEQSAEQNSPQRLCSCAQDLIERELLAAVGAEATATVTFGSEVTGYTASEDGAVLTVVRGGASREIAARYVIGADGARSTMRELGAIDVERSLPLGRRANIYFHADLREQTRQRPYILWTIMSSSTQGIFIALDGGTRWVYSVELAPDETVDDYSSERILTHLRDATGVADLDPDVRSVLQWNIDMAIADRFAAAPLFLVGDAAHQFPPMGGFGMNSGIQDAHNLAWKLAAVLRGQAGARLLDTYESERRPVAVYNADQCMANAAAQQEAAKLMSDPQVLAMMAAESGGEMRAQFAAGVDLQKPEFHSQGQQFGYVYRSEAIVPDGAEVPESTIAIYRPTAAPGARLPHLRLRRLDGSTPSTVELAGGTWSLLVASQGGKWVDAAGLLGESGPTIATHVVGSVELAEAVAGSFTDVYGLTDTGAVLVRPDGHVAARWPAFVDDPERALSDAAAAILQR
ncbi:NAD(P)-binding protein [Gordonia sp. TBRC 11910]|uniref:NAD(P)-binding protein n=1 Tax=Gordonia asplenii TaxID=2725283 RepID=A0A848KZC3_9ACTN|nr:FAD-dependent oxidoreductase [Gordonia asplenii]NMO03562.1 NAD(P)-binding protein [Gordonia asplenii]